MSFYASGYPPPSREPTVFVKWVDADAGEVVSETEIPLARIPDDHEVLPGQRVTIFGSAWEIVRASPESAAQWRGTGALLVEVRRVR